MIYRYLVLAASFILLAIYTTFSLATIGTLGNSTRGLFILDVSIPI